MTLRRSIVLIAASLFAGGGYQLGHSMLVAPLASGRLEIPADRLDFGTVVEQKGFVYRLPVENRSSQAVEIASIERSCGCASVTPRSFTLAPFESRWLQLNLNLRGDDAFTYSGDERDFAVELRPVYAKAMTPGETWRVTGRVQSPFRIVERPLRFARDALIAGSDFAPLEFTIEPRAPFQKVTVALDAKSAPAQIASERRGDAIHVTLAPDGSLPIGAHEFRLSIAVMGADGAPQPGQTLRLPARVVPDVEIEPTYLRLNGPANGDSSDSRQVTLKSHTGTSFEILGVDLPDGLVSVSPLATDRESMAAYAVAATSFSAELSVKTVQFHVRSANARAGEFMVPLQVVMCSP